MNLKKDQQCQNSQKVNELYCTFLTVLRGVVGLCDIVLSREIWLNIILELRPHNEIYRKVIGHIIGRSYRPI